jgi:hypothetical protein
VKEVVVDLRVGERFVVLVALDEDLDVREEEVGAAVVGMQVRVDDMRDIAEPEPEPDLGEARFEQICGGQDRKNDFGGVFSPGRAVVATLLSKEVFHSVTGGNKKAAFAATSYCQKSPLTDSNRRPPPYHGTS